MSSIINPSKLTPFTIHEFKLFAPARVNQVNTFAYLDTGADHITISPKLAEGLPRTGTITLGSAFEQRVNVQTDTTDQDFSATVRTYVPLVLRLSSGGFHETAGISDRSLPGGGCYLQHQVHRQRPAGRPGAAGRNPRRILPVESRYN